MFQFQVDSSNKIQQQDRVKQSQIWHSNKFFRITAPGNQIQKRSFEIFAVLLFSLGQFNDHIGYYFIVWRSNFDPILSHAFNLSNFCESSQTTSIAQDLFMILKSPAENRFPIALKQVIIQKMISGLSLRLSVKAKRINANDVRIEMFLIKRIILAVLMLS